MSTNPAFAAPKPRPVPVLSAAEADHLANDLLAVMDELTAVVAQETEFVRLGRLGMAAEFATAKGELSRRYFADALRLQANNVKHTNPDKLETLRQRHNAFRAQLQINLTVLATAHAISEGIVRGVSGEMARKSVPQTYGASGRANAPSRPLSAPLAVSRML